VSNEKQQVELMGEFAPLARQNHGSHLHHFLLRSYQEKRSFFGLQLGVEHFAPLVDAMGMMMMMMMMMALMN